MFFWIRFFKSGGSIVNIMAKFASFVPFNVTKHGQNLNKGGG